MDIVDTIQKQIQSFILNTLARSSATPNELSKSLSAFLGRYRISIGSVAAALNQLQVDGTVHCIMTEPNVYDSFFALVSADNLPLFSMDADSLDDLTEKNNVELLDGPADVPLYLTIDSDDVLVLHANEQDLFIVVDQDEADQDDTTAPLPQDDLPQDEPVDTQTIIDTAVTDPITIAEPSADSADEQDRDDTVLPTVSDDQVTTAVDGSVEDQQDSAVESDEPIVADTLQPDVSESIVVEESVAIEETNGDVATDQIAAEPVSNDIVTDTDVPFAIAEDSGKEDCDIKDDNADNVLVNDTILMTQDDAPADTCDNTCIDNTAVDFAADTATDQIENDVPQDTAIAEEAGEIFVQNDILEQDTASRVNSVAEDTVDAEQAEIELTDVAETVDEVQPTTAADTTVTDDDSITNDTVADENSTANATIIDDVSAPDNSIDHLSTDDSVSADIVTTDDSNNTECLVADNTTVTDVAEADDTTDSEFAATDTQDSDEYYEVNDISNSDLDTTPIAENATIVTDDQPIDEQDDSVFAELAPTDNQPTDNSVDTSRSALDDTLYQPIDNDAVNTNESPATQTVQPVDEPVTQHEQAPQQQESSFVARNNFDRQYAPLYREERYEQDTPLFVDENKLKSNPLFADIFGFSPVEETVQPAQEEEETVAQDAPQEDMAEEPQAEFSEPISPADISEHLEEDIDPKRMTALQKLGMVPGEEEEKPAEQPAAPEYSPVMNPTSVLEEYLQTQEAANKYNFKSLLVSVFKDITPQQIESPQMSVDTPNGTTFGELREEMRKKGYTVSQYVRQNTYQYYNQKYINVNKLHLATSLITYLVALVMIMIGFFTVEPYAQIGWNYYVITAAVLLLLPAYRGIRYAIYKDKHAPANFSFKLSFATALMASVIAIVVVILFAFFVPGSAANISDISSLIAPIFYPSAVLLLIPISVIIYALLYRSKKFHL